MATCARCGTETVKGTPRMTRVREALGIRQGMVFPLCEDCRSRCGVVLQSGMVWERRELRRQVGNELSRQYYDVGHVGGAQCDDDGVPYGLDDESDDDGGYVYDSEGETDPLEF